MGFEYLEVEGDKDVDPTIGEIVCRETVAGDQTGIVRIGDRSRLAEVWLLHETHVLLQISVQNTPAPP
jgi:hypothetical protein